MPKLDLNLDAYRLVAECLFRIRHVLRDALHSAHGDAWDEAGIPPELHGHLSQRRAREASINWHLTDSCDLLDYAGFANIYDVIAANPELTGRFASLAPDPNVLRIRFLELDTILNRIAYVRSVSETEMGFLVSFDERLRRLASEAPDARRIDKERPASPPAQASARGPEPTVAPAQHAPTPVPKQPETGASKERERDKGKAKEPTPAPAEEVSAKDSGRTTPRDKADAGTNGKAIEAALRDGDEGSLLSALYREITALADGLWSQAAPGPPKVWEQIRESDWYRAQFAKLGLKPVSDFYVLVDEARERLLAGTSRSDLQEFLKERNFAQVLLALRELFKHHLTN
ncbi:MAG: hypothetical protein ACM3O7_03785 [Acidobacteriota bacterium]